MTEEQRYRQTTDMKRDEIKCLKGIWDTLVKIQEQLEKQIKGSIVYADGTPYVIGVDLSKDEQEQLEKHMKTPIEAAKSYKEDTNGESINYANNPDGEFVSDPEAAKSYMSYSEFLNSPEAADHYKDAMFNGEYHGETINPSDPKYK